MFTHVYQGVYCFVQIQVWSICIMEQKLNNSNPKKQNHSESGSSGVSVSFRLSETLLAVVITSVLVGGASFGFGVNFANSQNQNTQPILQNQK